jgi:uncharacterized protein
MSQQNLAVVKQLFNAFEGEGDLFDLVADDVVWEYVGNRKDFPYAGKWHGHAEMMKFFTAQGEGTNQNEFTIREMFAADDKVIVLGHENMQVRSTRKTYDTDWLMLFTVQNGKITRLRMFADTAAIAAAWRRD